MKRSIQRLSTVVALAAIVMFSACSKTEELPSNVIEDATGINVDLDWTTGGSSVAATQEADLDLYFYKDGTEIEALSSASFSSFERTEFNSALYADGEYIVKVSFFSASKDVDFTLTVNGRQTSKPLQYTGSFAAETEMDTEIEVVKVVKSGSKYTVTEL